MNFDPVALLGLILVFIICVGLLYVDYSGKYPYKLADFVTTGDRYDLAKLGVFVALVTMTFGYVYMLINGGLTEWFVTIYVTAFVVNGFGNLWARIKGSPTMPNPGIVTVESTVESKSTTKSTDVKRGKP